MKCLIITSGSSQLVTQLSVLKKRNIDFSNVYLIYTGLQSGSLDVFFNQVSAQYGFKYIGQILFDIYPVKLSKKEFLKYLFTKKFKRLTSQIEDKYSLLKNYRNFQLVLIPVRVKVLEDTVLLSYLKPKEILFIADGVIDVLPSRDLNKLQYYYLKNALTRFPIKSKIYSPFFLNKDIATIGKFEKINIVDTLKEVSNIELAETFKKLYLNETISHVIVSQHYHLHENISLENDILYYKQVIDYALTHSGNSKILFKPHPRDVKSKIEKIQQLADQNVLVVNDDLKSVPIEVFGEYFREHKTTFLTGNSSAPLYFKKSNNVISICSEKHLHLALNERIKEFANKYNIDFINL